MGQLCFVWLSTWLDAVLLLHTYMSEDKDLAAVNPGFGGQKFIPSQVKKIKKLRELCNERGVDPWIEVDGGVSGANAYQVST